MPTCATSGCHDAGSAAGSGNLSLEPSVAYAQLVGMAADQNNALQRVEPFNPDNSYLIQKLEGAAGISGNVMPPGSPLPQSSIDVIRQWITDGALDDTVAPVTAVRITSVTPAPGSDLPSPPAQIVVTFDRDIDAATVDTNSFVLEGAGGDGLFGDVNDFTVTPVSAALSSANPRIAIMDLSGVAMPDDTYRVILYGNGASIIQDIDGNALDGENFGGFPSGNGTAGGNYAAMFSVTAPIVIGPTLDQIQAVVFGPSCSSCHGGANPSEQLDLSDADTSFAELVGVPSVQQPGVLLVAPNDPDASYLIRKLENDPSIDGNRMPLGSALDPAVIAEIRTWIANGALRN